MGCGVQGVGCIGHRVKGMRVSWAGSRTGGGRDLEAKPYKSSFRNPEP